MSSRQLIGQAVGVLMERCTIVEKAAQAFLWPSRAVEVSSWTVEGMIWLAMNEFSDPPAHLVGESSELPGVRHLLPQRPLETRTEGAEPHERSEPPEPVAPPGPDMPPRREAGWFRDPAQALRHRYWTGVRWFAQDEVFPELDDGPAPD